MPVNLITMVFTDLVDSTAIKLRLPGADVTARNLVYLETILAPHRGRVEAELAAFGGRTVKTEGDAYFLVFDDTVTAARWAVGVQQSHHDDPIATPFGPLRVKIGIHTGSPLPDPHNPGDLIGHEVDYAARIAALACGGQITLSEAAAVLIRAGLVSGTASHDHGERELKGIGRVPVFELIYGANAPQPLKEAALSPTNLPPPPASFTGRSELLALLRESIHEGGLMVLKGEGGIGKTTLATRAAHDAHAAGEIPGGVAWLNCELAPGLEECLRQMAQVFLGDRLESESLDSCRARVSQHLTGRAALVVFDNFESVAHDVEILRWLAGLRPPARALITTREVPPGLAGRVIDVRELTRAEATSLFRGRASAKGQALDGQERLVDELCAAVGDQPLAIELLAARAASIPLTRLLERMRRDVGVLDARSDPTRPGRHQSATACFAMSYEALDAPARGLLLALCVLPGGVGPDLIAEVSGSKNWEDSAEVLVTSSVWRLVEERYVMHPLVRQCALESLGAGRADAESRTARALARLAIGASARLGRMTGGAPYIAALDWFAAEWGNLVTSAVSAADAGDGKTVVDLAESIFDFCIARGYWSDAERLHLLALAAARRSADRPDVVKLLGQLGRIHRRQGRWAEAVAAYQEALGLARQIDDRVMQGRLLGNLSRIYQLQGEYDQSVAAASESLEILRAAEDPIGQVESLICLGSVHRFQRRFPEAEAAYREGIAIARQVRDRKSEGKALSYLGKVYGHQKRWAEALVEYEASLLIVREFGDRMGEASITQNQGTVYLERGALQDSEAALTLCLDISRDLNDRVMEGRALRSFARLRARSGDADAALDLARRSVALLEKTEDRWNLARSREILDEIEHSDAGPIADAGEGDVPVGPEPSR